jgi:effector-binding domain-containing protein
MLRKQKLLLLLLAASLLAVSVMEISAQQGTDYPAVSIRKVESQTVLYTVYRGHYEKIGQPIGELYALAGKKKIIPRGSVTLVYLNTPIYSSMEHCLTEIRIPVGQDVLKLAGTFGPMIDVKTVRSMDLAVMTKSIGNYDYAGIYEYLYTWIANNGYRPTDNVFEVFLADSNNLNFEQMKSEIMIPIVKVSSIKQ